MKIKHIIMILVALLILCSLASCKKDLNNDLVGHFSNDGTRYISYNELFEINNKSYTSEKFLLNDIQFADHLDDYGYRVAYSSGGHVIYDFFFYRNTITPAEFEVIAKKKVDSIGSWSELTYSSIVEIDDFTFYFAHYNIIGESPYSNDNKDFNFGQTFLFCYNDSIQLVIGKFLSANASFGDQAAKLRRGKYMEKRLLFIFEENLTLFNKLFEEGIPEPINEVN